MNEGKCDHKNTGRVTDSLGICCSRCGNTVSEEPPMTEDREMSDWNKKEYTRLAHSIQSATAFLMEHGNSHNPKHLRTGLNILFAEHAAIAELLVKKSIITREEYEASLLKGLQEELDRLTKEAREKAGNDSLNFA